MELTPEEHVEIITEVNTKLDEDQCIGLKNISKDRKVFAQKLLEIFCTTDAAKKHGLTDPAKLKAAMMATKKHKDVYGAQAMLFGIIGYTEKWPTILAVVWTL